MSKTQIHPKATNLATVGRFAKPEPLQSDTWGQYVDTDQARGSREVANLIDLLRDSHREGMTTRAIFAGHRGCGKSTELARVSDAVKDLYAGEICVVSERYSLPMLDWRQLLFLCADVLMQYARRCQVDLSKGDIGLVQGWFDETTVKEVSSDGYRLEAEAGANLSFLGQLFAKVSAKIFSGGETQESVTRYIERRFDSLMDNMRILVDAIEKKIQPRRLLLILEGLDKVESLKQSRELFIEHRLQLLSLPCSVIFTFPIRLWYEPDGGVEGYDQRFLLPMIPIAEAPASVDQPAELALQKATKGQDTLREIVLRRIESELIEQGALTYLIKFSGGVIRDLLYMLRDAALNARYEKRDQILLRDCERAARRLRSDYAKHLSAPAQSSDIKVEDILKTLSRPSDWPRRQTAPTAAFKLLLQSLCILEYNGDTWYDLHPLIRQHLEITLADEERRAKLHTEV